MRHLCMPSVQKQRSLSPLWQNHEIGKDRTTLAKQTPQNDISFQIMYFKIRTV